VYLFTYLVSVLLLLLLLLLSLRDIIITTGYYYYYNGITTGYYYYYYYYYYSYTHIFNFIYYEIISQLVCLLNCFVDVVYIFICNYRLLVCQHYFGICIDINIYKINIIIIIICLLLLVSLLFLLLILLLFIVMLLV